jgi:hypothetical protein
MLLVYRYGSEVNPLTEKGMDASNLEVLGGMHLRCQHSPSRNVRHVSDMGEHD